MLQIFCPPLVRFRGADIPRQPPLFSSSTARRKSLSDSCVIPHNGIMVGTRLVVHATLVVELLVLIAASFLYAYGRRHDPYSSAEPFLPDRSGWRLLVEDVSPAPSNEEDTGSLVYVGECATAVISKIRSLVGLQSEGGGDEQHVMIQRPRRVSAFVQEMRLKIAGFRFADEDNREESTVPTIGILPPLKVVLYIPQVKSSSTLNSLSEALERGFLGQSTRSPDFHSVKLSLADSPTDHRYDHADVVACDDYHLPVQSELTTSNREVKHPEILVLLGCTDVTIPDGQTSSVEVSSGGDVIVVRTMLAVEQNDELRSYLENHASREILTSISIASRRRGCRLGRVSVDLIDENPASHVDEGSSSASKSRFDVIGRALSSSVRSTIGPILDDLSFVYGGEIAVGWGGMIEFGHENVITSKVAIGLEAHSSAYASLSGNVVKANGSADYQLNVTNFVSSQTLTDWAYAHSRQPVRYAQTGLDCRDDVRWTLVVPSRENSPLQVRDDSGEFGESIIFSSPESIGGRTSVYPHGLSVINLSKFGEYFESNVDEFDLNLPSYQSYKNLISASLIHLVGYLRAIHGLTASMTANDQGLRTVTFWELESIARSHYYPSLEIAFHETDALFAVLNQHGSSLALPEDVAHGLNNATYLLRQSIYLVEQGYPMMYATSLLHGSLWHLESVKIDHRIIEVPYFAPDHYLAVFSPLVLPLLLPMMSGLIREVKRFRTLRKERHGTY
jgi:hypothetical protein